MGLTGIAKSYFPIQLTFSSVPTSYALSALTRTSSTPPEQREPRDEKPERRAANPSFDAATERPRAPLRSTLRTAVTREVISEVEIPEATTEAPAEPQPTARTIDIVA